MIEHPQRLSLHNEIHARPRQPVTPPVRVSHLALLRRPGSVAGPAPSLVQLCVEHALPPPAPGQDHLFGDFGRFQLKWERHGEFDDYTIYAPGCTPQRPFDLPASQELPASWRERVEGELIAAVHVAVVGPDPRWDDVAEVAQALGAVDVVGSRIGEGAACAFSDFRLDAGGFSRFLLINQSMRPNQLGREVQRLIEIEVYRMMAMIGFAPARQAARDLGDIERRLGTLVSSLQTAQADQEPAILNEVTQLAAAVERLAGDTGFRFAATRAYHALVRKRGEELREVRLSGILPITAFLDRRFGPAMAYCESVARRLDATADRVARASGLLRTRVEIEQEQQNQKLLAAMNRRAHLQLRLQQTVEGLSVAAITYYATGIASYLFKAAKGLGWTIDVDLATGLSVIPIALTVAWGLRRVHHGIRRRLDEGGATVEAD